MAEVGSFDYKNYLRVDQAAVNDKLTADIALLTGQLALINVEVAKKVNLSTIAHDLRAAVPKQYPQGSIIDFNELDFGEYLMYSFGDGSTHAPPKSEYYYVEVICTLKRTDGTFNILQRAWSYTTGHLYTRSRIGGVWGAWIATTTAPTTE